MRFSNAADLRPEQEPKDSLCRPPLRPAALKPSGCRPRLRLYGGAQGRSSALRLRPHVNCGLRAAARRSVAQLARAPVSKTGGWGFESLHSCQRSAVSFSVIRLT